jgi:hypothetical protein
LLVVELEAAVHMEYRAVVVPEVYCKVVQHYHLAQHILLLLVVEVQLQLSLLLRLRLELHQLMETIQQSPVHRQVFLLLLLLVVAQEDFIFLLQRL